MKKLSLVLFVLLVFAGTAFAEDCNFIKTYNNHRVNPRYVTVVQSFTQQKIKTGSNSYRYKIMLIIKDGTQILYQSYDFETQRDSKLDTLTSRIEQCQEN